PPSARSIYTLSLHDALPILRLIHSLASESATRQLEKHPAGEVLIEVNVAGEENKAGIAPTELASFIDRCPAPVTGLMTMPPFVRDRKSTRLNSSHQIISYAV